MIVGLSGRHGSSKNYTADLLSKELGFRRLSFTDKIEELTANLLNVPLKAVKQPEFKDHPILAGAFGMWNGLDVLQLLGHEACRKTFGENFWVDQLISQLPPGHAYEPRSDGRCNYTRGPMDPNPCCGREASEHADHVVVSGIHFWNEVEAIKDRGGLIVRLNRSGAAKTRHEFQDNLSEGFIGCGAPVGLPGSEYDTQKICKLPERAHPSHYSDDTHESETTLPDSGGCYDLVVEGATKEEAAKAVLAQVQRWMIGVNVARGL